MSNPDLELTEKIPSQLDVIVLPADEPSQNPKLGFVVYERSGTPVFLLTEDGKVVKELVTDRAGLQDGMKVYAYGSLWTVRTGEAGNLHLDASRSIGCLSFDEDDRHCWCCTGSINKRLIKGAIKKFTIVGE